MAKIPLAWARMSLPCAPSTRQPFATIRLPSWWNSYGVWRAPPIRIIPTRRSLLTQQAQVLQLLQRFQGPRATLTAVKNPWNFSTLRPVIQCGPPALGNATGAVLAALGYTAAQRQQLFDTGVVAGSHDGRPAGAADTTGLALPTPAAPALVQRRGGPLAGVRVLDISGLGVGPVTGLFLAELGAEVVKVEPPHGDLAHTVLPRQRGTSVLYISANLCKRGVVLNLKDPRDLERAYRLAERSDVFVENFRVGVVERLGLGYQILSERNPRLIYCSISGFGRHGPLALLPSVDPYIQAFSGFASLNGSPGSRGESLRNIGFIDLNTSALTVPAILAALVARERTGMGQHIVASMLEAAVDAANEPYRRIFCDRAESLYPAVAACLTAYQTRRFACGMGISR